MAPTTSSFRAMSHENMSTGSSSGAGCGYTDGPQYVGCQVAAKGWPTPQYMSGGKRKRKLSKKEESLEEKSKRAGSLVGNAIVPSDYLLLKKEPNVVTVIIMANPIKKEDLLEDVVK